MSQSSQKDVLAKEINDMFDGCKSDGTSSIKVDKYGNVENVFQGVHHKFNLNDLTRLTTSDPNQGTGIDVACKNCISTA
jgi:hypothetical protein